MQNETFRSMDTAETPASAHGPLANPVLDHFFLFGLVFAGLFFVFPQLAAGEISEPVLDRPVLDRPVSEERLEQTFEQAGVSVTLRLFGLDAPAESTLREGDSVRFEFEIRDAAKEPMSGAFPAAWMDLLPAGEESDSGSCKDKLGGFISGSLLFQPELDLNVYYVLTLNEDASISVVDPLFGFGGSKLLDMVLLEAPGLDWQLSLDQSRLFVSMPEADAVAVIDTATWQVLTHLRVGPRPTRLALQGDGSHLFVAYGDDRHSGLAMVRTANLSQVADLRFEEAAGASAPDLVFSDDERLAYLTRPASRGVAVIDLHARVVLETLDTGADPTSIAWSSAARMAYVAHADGRIVALGGGEKPRIIATLQGDPGPGPIRFAPGGRYAFVPVPGTDAVHIVDAARNRIVQTADVEDQPDRVTFSNELAYIRHRGSEIVLTVPLHQIGRDGEPVPVIDFPGGQAPPGRTDQPSLADGIVQAPGADAVLVANPEDKVIYFYKEGMAAPMGNFKNYGRQPRAVEVVDRSLRESSPGIYRTEAKLRRPGRYDVAFFMDAPRTLHCFSVEVAPNPVLAAERRSARPLLVEAVPVDSPRTGETVPIRFTLRDSHTREALDDLEDVTILAFLAPGTWQRRYPAEALGDGLYEVRIEPEEEGIYYAFVSVPSKGLGFQRARPSIFQVVPSLSEL